MVTVTVLGNNLFTVVLAISVGVVPRFARLTRGTILSIRERDYPTIMGLVLMFSFLTLLGQLLADVLYAVVDPRVTYS